MKKTYVLQMQAQPWTPWVVVREYDTLAEARDAYYALPDKTRYRLAEAYTQVRYKPMRAVKKGTAPTESGQERQWLRFELCISGAEKKELYDLLDRLKLSRRELALIVLGLRVRPGFSLEDFDT